MDPFTQGTLGAAFPQALQTGNTHARIAGTLGFLAGMAADLDVFIRSANDPLLFLEYHRQFTHSLIFIPAGGLLTALALHWALGKRWRLLFWQTMIFCTLGYATHALLDACTSYGTQLFWPFSQERFAWKIISVVDPLFTLPLAALAAVAAVKRKAIYARLALIWALAYLTVGAIQHGSARQMGKELALSRGHTIERLEVKPSFGNIIVWKVLYEAGGRYYVDAVRTGISPAVFPGNSVQKLDLTRDLAWLDEATQQARDLERFRWFSDDFLALDPERSSRVIDVRYSIFPNEINALWSIELRKEARPGEHVRFVTHRENARERLGDLWQLITGSRAAQS